MREETRPGRVTWQITLWALSLWLGGGSVRAQQPQPPMVLACVGLSPVQAQRPGTTQVRDLHEQDILSPGETVRTGPESRASLLLAGSKFDLRVNTEVVVLPAQSPVKGRPVLLHVLRGEVHGVARPHWAIWTESAIAAISGTELDLQVNAESHTTILTVQEGSVEFANSLGGYTVAARQQSIAVLGHAPTPPFTVPAGSLSLDWTVDLSRAQATREWFFVGLDRAALNAALTRRTAAARAVPADVQAQAALGDVLFDLGRFDRANYEKALAQYRQAASLSPQPDPALLTRQGDTLLALGRVDDAQAAYQNAGPTPPALAGLAWTALARNLPTGPAEAQDFAQRALAAETNPAEDTTDARIALGVALLRRPGQELAGQAALREALVRAPAARRGQAHAWLSLGALGRGDVAGAVAEGRAATAAAPTSSLAHEALSQALFLSDRPEAAAREGQEAARLSPNSVAAQLALGQAHLMAGDPDGAATAGATAAALDPRLPEGFYLEGVADLARGDLPHAERELSQAATIAPDFTAATVALGRVLTREGHPGDARTLLAAALAGHPDDAGLHQALGEAWYNQGHYGEALAEEETAARLRPDSATTQALLSRVALDDNRLDVAIHAAQQAVQLAPGVAQFHALLGLAYSYGLETDFTGPDARAEQEFREALALDSQNALSRLELGLLTFGTANGERPESRLANATAVQLSSISQGTSLFAEPARPKNAATALNSLTQAILFDPYVTNQTLQGGINTEVTPLVDRRKARSLFADHRDQFLNGREHDLIQYRDSADSFRAAHSDSRDTNFIANLALAPDSNTTIAGAIIHQRASQQFPTYGASDPSGLPAVTDARQSSDGDLGEIALRRRLNAHSSLWIGLGGLFTRDRFAYPSIPTPNLVGVSRNIVPEVRTDITLVGRGLRGTRLTLGGANAPQTVSTTFDLLEPSFPFGFSSQAHDSSPVSGFVDSTTAYRARTAATNLYLQVAGPTGGAFSFVGLLRQERLQTTINSSFAATDQPGNPESILLPSALIAYHPDGRATLRLLAGRARQDTTLLTFLPTETLLPTEPDIIPLGDSDQAEVLEVDAERYTSSGTFVKLFGFHTLARDLVVGSNQTDLPFPVTEIAERVTRDGLGFRYEHPLSRTLFAKLYLLADHTANHQQVPVLGPSANTFAIPTGRLVFQSERSVQFSLDHIDRTGTKAGLRLRYEGNIQDREATLRPDGSPYERRFLFPAQTYLDLRFAKQWSVHHELFVQINNVFNTAVIQFNNLPRLGRQVQIGFTLRF